MSFVRGSRKVSLSLFRLWTRSYIQPTCGSKNLHCKTLEQKGCKYTGSVKLERNMTAQQSGGEATAMSSISSKPVVGVTSRFLDLVPKLTSACDSALFVPLNFEELSVERLQDFEIILADPPLIGKWVYELRKLKWFQSTYVGVDAIFANLRMNQPQLFVITKIRGSFSTMLSEYVVGQIISRERNFPKAWKDQTSKVWPSPVGAGFRLLSDLTIGIIGFGEIGQEIARYCKAAKMTVFSVHRNAPSSKALFSDENFSLKDLPNCLRKCDYFCNVLPCTTETTGLLAGDVLKNCEEKKTVFINVGRSNVLKDEDVLRALDNGWIGGAILDVFDVEPLPQESRLWTHPQVTISPHVAGLTSDNEVVKLFLENLELYKSGKPLKNVVDWSKGY